MEHVFICYSRQDQKYALHLEEALKKAGKNVWIDTKDLPVSSIWRKEIQQAITESIAFVYLASGNALNSDYCKKELGFAWQQNKRVFPILLPGITDKIIPETISTFQWLNWSDFGEECSNIEKLIISIETNYKWVKFHTNLLVKATHWEEQKKDHSRLLWGKELQETKKQLVIADSQQEPRITISQQNFFLESQKREKLTKRRNLTILVLLSIIIPVLLVALINQLDVARAQKLGTVSEAFFEAKDFNKAALYAYQANQISENHQASKVLGKLPYKNFSPGKILFKHYSEVLCVDWSYDGRLASGAIDGNIIIWDVESGEPIYVLQGHKDAIESVSWSPDGRLASGSRDGTIIIWDTENGEALQTLKGHAESVYTVDWSTNGQLASGSGDTTIILWDLIHNKPAKILKGHTDRVYAISWSKDGRLASGGDDGFLIVWDVKTGEKLKKFIDTDRIFGIRSVAWSNDGQLASDSGSSPPKVIIWDIENEKPAKIIPGSFQSSALNVAWSFDGHLAIGSWDETVTLWDLNKDEPIEILSEHLSAVSDVAWSNDGQLASASYDGTIIVWGVSQYEEARTFQDKNMGAIYNIASSSSGDLASSSVHGVVFVWNKESENPKQITTEEFNKIYRVAWSNEDKLTLASDHVITIWDLEKNQPSYTFNLGSAHNEIVTIDWSKNGLLAASTSDGYVVILDVKSNKLIQEMQIQKDQSMTSSFVVLHELSPASIDWYKNDRLAIGAPDGTVIIWDLGKKEPTKILLGHKSDVESVAWSKDGKLASGSLDGTLIVWDLNNDKPLRIFDKHSGSVNSISWSDDGKLASGSSDKSIIVWDTKSGDFIYTLLGHTDEVASIVWLGDGRIASGSYDKTIQISRADLISPPCNWLMRNMYEKEWLAYQGQLYAYEPACENLPELIVDPMLKQRPRILIVILVLCIFGFGWIIIYFIFWLWKKIVGKK